MSCCVSIYTLYILGAQLFYRRRCAAFGALFIDAVQHACELVCASFGVGVVLVMSGVVVLYHIVVVKQSMRTLILARTKGKSTSVFFFFARYVAVVSRLVSTHHVLDPVVGGGECAQGLSTFADLP